MRRGSSQIITTGFSAAASATRCSSGFLFGCHQTDELVCSNLSVVPYLVIPCSDTTEQAGNRNNMISDTTSSWGCSRLYLTFNWAQHIICPCFIPATQLLMYMLAHCACDLKMGECLQCLFGFAPEMLLDHSGEMSLFVNDTEHLRSPCLNWCMFYLHTKSSCWLCKVQKASVSLFLKWQHEASGCNYKSKQDDHIDRDQLICLLLLVEITVWPQMKRRVVVPGKNEFVNLF